MCKNRLRNDRKIFKIPSLQFQHGISNFRIFCCDFPIFASENFKKKSLIFYPYTFYTTLEKISKKGKYTTRYWQLLLTYFQSKREKKNNFQKNKYLQSFHRPFVWEFFFLWPSNKESSLFQYRFRIADPGKTTKIRTQGQQCFPWRS